MYEGQQLRQKGSLVARRMLWHAWPRALGASRTFQNGAVGSTRFCSTHGGGPLCQQPAGPCTNGALGGTRLCSLSAHGGGPRRQLPADCGDPSSCPGAAGGTGPCRRRRMQADMRRAAGAHHIADAAPGPCAAAPVCRSDHRPDPLSLCSGIGSTDWSWGSLPLLRVVADSQAGKWQSAWVEHIQVASGRSAALESSTSESRVAAGVRGSSLQLCLALCF